MHPITQGLAVHPILPRRFGAGFAVQDQRQRQQAADHLGILVPGRQMPQFFGRVVLIGDRNRLTHPTPHRESAPRDGIGIQPGWESGGFCEVARLG